MKYEREYAWEVICEEAIKRFENQYRDPENPAYRFFLLCHEHYKGFFLLCRNGLYRSAQPLLQPMLEALLRGWWLSNHAGNKERRKFAKRGKIPRTSKLEKLIISDSEARERFLPQDLQDLLNDFADADAMQLTSTQWSEETTDEIRSIAASISYSAMLQLADCIGRADVVDLLEKSYSELMGHYTLDGQGSGSDAG